LGKLYRLADYRGEWHGIAAQGDFDGMAADRRRDHLMGGGFTWRLGAGARSEIVDDGDVVAGEINLTGLDLSSYYTIRVYLSGLKVNADDNSIALQLEMGGSVVSSGYQESYTDRESAGSTTSGGSTSIAYIELHNPGAGEGVGNASGESLSGYLDIGNAVSSLNKFVTGHITYRQPNGQSVYTTMSGMLANTGNITGFRLFCTNGGGSLTAGRVFLMGLS
jgi:hypothetical protein